MGSVNDSILKIRKLINDREATPVFTDASIAQVLWRAEVAFATETRCCVTTTTISSVPAWDFCITQLWESRACELATNSNIGVADLKIRHINSKMYPFEVEGATAITVGGSLATAGFEIAFCNDDLVETMPFYLPTNNLAVIQLLFDGRVLFLRSVTELDFEYTGPGTKIGGVVNAFALEEYNDSRFISNVVPVETDLLFTAVYEEIPTKEPVIAPGEAIPYASETRIYAPFAKYAEYKAASILLSAETEKRNPNKAAHYQVRYAMGVNIVKRILAVLGALPTRTLGNNLLTKRGRRPYPRLPDHYPALRVR